MDLPVRNGVHHIQGGATTTTGGSYCYSHISYQTAYTTYTIQGTDIITTTLSIAASFAAAAALLSAATTTTTAA
jgi:hypothetical protein